MKNIMNCSVEILRRYGTYIEDKHEYETCMFTKKNIYSYAQAQQVMRGLKHCKNRNHNKVYLRAYKCKRCNGWHLTSSITFQYKGNRDLDFMKESAC